MTGDLKPQNYRKHAKKPAFELTFSSDKEVDQFMGIELDIEGQKPVLQRGVSNENILKIMRVHDIPINSNNRTAIMQEVSQEISKIGTVLDVRNEDNKGKKKTFWQAPLNMVDVQVLLPKDYFKDEKCIKECINVQSNICKIYYFGKQMGCFKCGQKGHFRKDCKSNQKRTRNNEPKMAEKRVFKSENKVINLNTSNLGSSIYANSKITSQKNAQVSEKQTVEKAVSENTKNTETNP